MTLGVCELLWIKNVLSDLDFKQNETMSLYCDNTSTIAIAHNQVQHDRTKHVEIDRQFIKEKLEVGIIYFFFVRSELCSWLMFSRKKCQTEYLMSLSIQVGNV